MNKQRFSQLVRHYREIQDDDRVKLHELVKGHPYSQIIHTLIAKANADAKTDVAKQTLNYAALYTSDRNVLKSIILDQNSSIASEAIERPIEKLNKTKEESKSEEVDTASENIHELSKTLTTQDSETSASSVNHEKVSVSTDLLTKTDIEDLRSEIWADLKRLELNKKNYLTTVEKIKPTAKVTAKKASTTKSKTAGAKPKATGPTKPKTAGATKAKTTTSKTKSTTASKPKTSTASKTKATTTRKSTTSKTVKSTTSAKTPAKRKVSSSTKKTTTKPKPKNTTTTKASAKKVDVKKKPVIKEQQDIINKFIDKEPRIKAQKNGPAKVEDQQDLSQPSTQFGEDLISENLAQILLNQGKKDKAIDIYKKLIWKFPQKKSYFAALIEDLKK